MRLLVSLDPGLRACGVGAFDLDAKTLVWGALVKNPVRQARGPDAWWGMARAVDDALLCAAAWPARPVVVEFVTEIPQVYRFGRSKGDPDDLLQLAGVAGAVGAILRPDRAAGYYPRQWKGQVPKDVMCRRIESRLTPAERAALVKCAPSLRHNMLDGAGVGLFHLGRLGGSR